MTTPLQKINPLGKLVRFENLSLVADISQKAGSWDINELYHTSGAKMEKGDLLGEGDGGKIFNEELYDKIYDELDRENFYDVKTSQKKEEKIVKIAQRTNEPTLL